MSLSSQRMSCPASYRVASWNVNSIQARLPLVCDWLRRHPVDVLLLQEIKCIAEHFPKECFDDMGYHVSVYGQKTYHGVAIISRWPLENVMRGFSDDPDPLQARYIEGIMIPPGTQDVMHLASVYVPNGRDENHADFVYKQRFFEALERHFAALYRCELPVIIGGDYNVAPNEQDAHPCFSPLSTIGISSKERYWFDRLLRQGWIDGWPHYIQAKSYDKAMRHTPELLPSIPPTDDDDALWGWTWWDYRHRSWPQNQGMRIDHMILSYEAADAMIAMYVDKEMRGQERPSDHVPIMLEIRGR